MEKENLARGAAFSVGAFFFMACFGAFAKAAHNAFWANFIAFVTGACIWPFIFRESFFRFLKTKHFTLHFFRALVGVSASIAYVYSIRFIPLLNATLLYNATPLFIPFFSMIFLKEKVAPLTWVAILIGYIGVVLVIGPSGKILDHVGDFWAVASGVLLALAFTFVKKLTRTEPLLRIVVYYFILATLMQIPFIAFFGPVPSWVSIGFSVLAGISLVLAQVGIALSYGLAPASKVGLFQYSAVVFVGLIDYIFWNVVPHPLEWIGAIIVVLSGSLLIAKRRK